MTKVARARVIEIEQRDAGAVPEMHAIAYLHDHDIVIVDTTRVRTCNCAGQHPFRRSCARDVSPQGRPNIGVHDIMLVFALDFWRFVAGVVSGTLESGGNLAIWLTH